MITSSTKKNRLKLALIVVAVLVIGIVIGKVIADVQTGRERAANKAQLSTALHSLHMAYMKTPPREQTLSGQSVEQQPAFLTTAAKYYGVDLASGSYGQPPAAAEVVGACMRARNMDLAASLRGLDTPTIMSENAAITELRKMIATDCYARYSPDGTLPAQFNSAIHNH